MKLRIARKIIMSSDEDKESNEFFDMLFKSGVVKKLLDQWSLTPELLSAENATYSR